MIAQLKTQESRLPNLVQKVARKVSVLKAKRSVWKGINGNVSFIVLNFKNSTFTVFCDYNSYGYQ